MRIKLKQAFDLQMGKTPARNNMEFWGGTYKWISIADLGNAGKYIDSTKESISDEGVEASGIKIVPKGTVVMSFKLSIGKTAITSEDMYTNEAIIAFNNNGTYEIAADYLYHFCCGTNWGAGTNKAVMGLTLNKATLSEYEIEVPDISEQREIAKKLDGVDTLIEKHRAQLVALDELVKSRFIELFGDPKLNEKGWKTGVISDYYEVKGGKRIPKGMGYSDEVTNHPYLRATDMKNETILDEDIHYIDDEVFEKIKRYTVKGGDIYLTNVGVNLGMAGVIPEKYAGANLTENAVKLVPKSEKIIDGMFLAHYINSPGIQDYINERKMSVGVPKLAIFRIETMPLILPPMDMQMNFIEFCKQVDKSKYCRGKSRRLLQRARVASI